MEFEESLATKVPPIPLDHMIIIPGSYSRKLPEETLDSIVHELRLRELGDLVLATALRENYQLVCSQLVEALALVGNSVQCVELIQDKPACRDALRSAGVFQPQSLRIAGVDPDGRVRVLGGLGAGTADVLTSRSGWIVKPATGMGSSGVTYIAGIDELQGLGPEVFAGGYCLEEYVLGEEFSAEGITVGGQVRLYGATTKTKNENFVEIGHRHPAAPQGFPTLEDLSLQLQECLAALGIQWGHLHVEFWVGPDGSVVWGEFHVRQAGGFIAPDLVEAARPGLDIYGELIDSLRGLPLDELPSLTACAGVEFIEAAPGRVMATAIEDEVPADAQIYWECKPGDYLMAVNGLRSHVAVVVAQSHDSEALESLLGIASKACNYRIDLLEGSNK
ncbi:acetyl-CoA carboxylase biotin carboxylase subunit family protein [Paenarthrobacter sp. NPDC058040]|uniref:ATP-grasp domain-containing protein n=1 Tax=unclassified Paenarthrobacter TaxID=2634190 RepID=UPI0036DA4A58